MSLKTERQRPEDDTPPKARTKNKSAQSLGSLGGAARAKSLSSKQRSEIAKKAAAKRWAKG